MKTSIKEFKVDKKVLSTLRADEKKLIPVLTKAAKLADKIFLMQEADGRKGANFYPAGVSKEEIEEASKKNPAILSPYTIVEKDKEGKLTTVEYHNKYKNQLKPICSLIGQAANIAQNKSFKNYLKILNQSLFDGSYQKSDAAWLKVKNSNIDFVLGPHERYIDKLFFVKKVYQSSVMIIDKENTTRAKRIRAILYFNVGSRQHRIVPPSTVDVSVVHSLIFSGFLGRAMFSEQHMPTDPETEKKYGLKLLGYISSMDYKFEKMIYPIFKAVFEKKFQVNYSEDLLRRGNYYYVLLSGIARQLHVYENAMVRLKDLFPVYDEVNCVISGIQHAKHLVLKGVINQKELEAIMIVQICRAFSEWIISKKINTREAYLKGDTLALNFLIRKDALREKGGISWPNFAKMFFEIENLATIFVRFLEEGNYSEAKKFLEKYLSMAPFKSFDKRLSKIKPV